MERHLGVYMRMIGGELTGLRWVHCDDQQGFLNQIEKQLSTSILKKK